MTTFFTVCDVITERKMGKDDGLSDRAQRDELLDACNGAIRAIEEGECDIALLYLRAAVKRSGQAEPPSGPLREIEK